jgi:tRNA 2-thiouridine synthesizing protein E
MPDINKLIAIENMPAFEAEQFLEDMEDWTEEQARDQAHAEGLELTDAHMEVICWLRDLYADCGRPEHGRALTQAMEDAFAEQGGKKYLYRLFPQGPVLQGCRLAGLPIPPYTVDRSFGSVH